MPPRQQSGPPRKREGRPRFFARKKVCSFCVDKVKLIDYKKVELIRRFISERGKIDGHRRTGTCPTHQRALTTALKRARHLALLPYSSSHVRFRQPAFR
jgi:small subunit ribosomal protein S18